MAVSKFSGNINVIAGLDDSPNLPAAELKAKFDEAAGLIKAYINQTLTEEIDTLIDDLAAAIPAVVDNLTSDDAGKALSAKQGKALKALIDGLAIPEVVDALTSTATNKALSANQGRVLKGLIPAVVDALTSDDAGKALSAKQGKALKALIDGLVIPAVVDNLTSYDTGKALSANQGRVLKGLIDGKQKTITVGTAAPSGGTDGDIYIRITG